MSEAWPLGAAAMARIDALALVSDDAERLTRLYLSPAHLRAIPLVSDWMRAAGMSVRVDAVGNVIGRYEGDAQDAPALILGSHIDTVVDAGRFDGNLGVVAAIAAIGELHREGRRLPFALEAIAFGDEEGVRFPEALLGSRAVAGVASQETLALRDSSGVSIAEALRALHPDAPPLASAAHRPKKCLAYLEAHIEQGPVLEAEGLALGVVTAINGAARYWIEFSGLAGHAGTVPMALRADALAAAAEMVLAVEELAKKTPALVATVGQIHAAPGAVNVIPGHVRLSLDIRGPNDAVRQRAAERLLQTAEAIGARRGVAAKAARFHDAPAVASDPDLVALLGGALRRLGQAPRILPSGAGHDAMAMARLCPMVMLFVRCKGGVSHHPDESVTVADLDLCIRAMLAFIEDFAREHAA